MAESKQEQQVLHHQMAQVLSTTKVGLANNQDLMRKEDLSGPLADRLPGKDPGKWWHRTRIHVALLGLIIAAVNCYAQATFCIAIVEMVLPADYVSINSTTTLVDDDYTWSKDQWSCPVEYEYRDYYDEWRFPRTNNSTTPTLAPTSQTIDVSNRFDWDAGKQGILLGAFAIGTAPLQIFGGRLAEIYGAKWVLFTGCLGTAVTNLTIPYLAHYSYILLVINRVIMGITQAGMEPGLMCLLADWLTPAETAFYISMLLFAICTGFFLGSLLSSLILSLGYGWPLVYYISGGLNLLVAIGWLMYADSWPRFSKYISSDELNFIEFEQQGRDGTNSSSANHSQHSTTIIPKDLITRIDELDRKSKETDLEKTSNISGGLNAGSQGDFSQTKALANPMKEQAPWKNILTTRSVWAFIICKFSVRWCADVIANELPTYLANVLHLSIKLNGFLNSMSSALFAIASFFTGWLVNKILTSQGFEIKSKTNVRKIFQSIASFGSALAVILMTAYDCNIIFSMSMLLVVSCLIVMGSGGELQIPFDMTSKYPGTLHGMACTMSVSGWLAPPLIGLILGDQPNSRYRWSIVWYLTAAINLLGGLVFVLFADSSPQNFDQKPLKRDDGSHERVGRHELADASSCSLIIGTTNNELESRDHLCGRQKQQRHSHQLGEQMEMSNDEGYYNIACRTLDCSPTQPKRCPHEQTTTTTMANISGATADYGRVKQLASSEAAGLYFDSKLIRIRQTEASFIKPNVSYYASNLDSPLASCRIVFPYQEKAADGPETVAVCGRSLKGAAYKQSQMLLEAKLGPSCEPTALSSSTGPMMSHWPLVGNWLSRMRTRRLRQRQRLRLQSPSEQQPRAEPRIANADEAGYHSRAAAAAASGDIAPAEAGPALGAPGGPLPAPDAGQRLAEPVGQTGASNNGLQPRPGAGERDTSGRHSEGAKLSDWRHGGGASEAADSETVARLEALPNGLPAARRSRRQLEQSTQDHRPPAELAHQLLGGRTKSRPPPQQPRVAPKTITHL